MQRIEYKEGDKVGKCFYISEEPKIGKGRASFRVGKFRCACGNVFIKIILEVKTGRVTCGCGLRNRINKHGYAKQGLKTKEYAAWMNIKSRCFNKNNPHYKNYGGRGITVCDRWVNSFEDFLLDMGVKPTPSHSIERVDNNGNYEPPNCKWVTRTEQNRNQRHNIYLEFNGEKTLLIEWAEKLGLKWATLYSRIFQYNWPIEKALTTPLKPQKKNILVN